MSPDEQARWDALPPEEQLARLRTAIQRGVDSGPAESPWTSILGPAAGPPSTMPSYRLSSRGCRDVEAIGDYGYRPPSVWRRLSKYHLALESRFELLGQFPRIGMPTYDLRPGLYRYPYQSHTIFYTIEPDHVFIVRAPLRWC